MTYILFKTKQVTVYRASWWPSGYEAYKQHTRFHSNRTLVAQISPHVSITRSNPVVSRCSPFRNGEKQEIGH